MNATEKTINLEPLILEIDPGEAPVELIAQLFVTLDALYRSEGGSGLQIRVEE